MIATTEPGSEVGEGASKKEEEEEEEKEIACDLGTPVFQTILSSKLESVVRLKCKRVGALSLCVLAVGCRYARALRVVEPTVLTGRQRTDGEPRSSRTGRSVLSKSKRSV